MVTVKHNFHDVNSWLEIQKERFTANEIQQFKTAITIAELAYQKQKFYPTDVDLLIHALTCANTVAELNLYADAVIATILFALPKFNANWQDVLAKDFSPKVIELIDGVRQVTQIRKLGALVATKNEQDKKEQVEVIRKMLLAMASDIRIVLIVLVGRGELMLNLKSCNNHELQHKIAMETVEVYAPLANRLGVWQIKWELEDLSFKYLHPEQYKKIANLLDETREERLDYIEQIKYFLSTQMEQGGITNYQISGRAKHIYSIWKKMKKKNYGFDDLYDIRALRVLVPEVKDCYTVLGIIHTKYSPIPGEFDDYISNPKKNEYQSLHTCVIGPDDKIVEIQIRTFAMHDHAEYGVAAHWRYKEFDTKDKANVNNKLFAEKLAWLRQILDWRDELTDRKDITDLFKNEIFNDTIYVLTPNGRVVPLPQGSTPIDFAYAVHSSVGHRCRGAKINGHIVPLATTLQNGQRVEVLTVTDGGPSIRWLHEGLVKSSKAISNIRRYIRNQNNEEFFVAGSEIFEREVAKFPASIRPKVTDIVAKLGYENEKMLCISVGKGELSPASVRHAIQKLITAQEQSSTNLVDNKSLVANIASKLAPKVDETKHTGGILIDGISGIVSFIAKCCKPIPGDEVIGFITHGRGVAIHRANCAEIKKQAKNTPEKLVAVSWTEGFEKLKFKADLEIIAYDHSNLLRDLTELFASEKIHIHGLRTVCRNNKAFMIFTLEIAGGIFNFDWLINKIFMIPGVIEVMRK